MTGNFPPHISDRDWADYHADHEDFDPSADDGNYSQSEDQ